MDFCLTGGEVADIKTASILTDINKMKCLIADKAYGSKKYRESLARRRIESCIPPKSNEKKPAPYDRQLYRKRHVIENLLAKLKDWKGIAFRANRCAHSFRSFVALALVFLFFNADRL